MNVVPPRPRRPLRIVAATAVIALLAVSLAAGQASLAQETAAPGPVIRFATEGAYPPFNFAEGDTVQGFEIDVARALCAEMKATCSFAIDDWDSLIPDLRAGKVDAIVASLEITEERRQKIAFSHPYYRTPAVFMGRTDSTVTDISPSGLKGLRLGAMENTVYSAYLEDRYAAGSEVKVYANQDEASLDLALGRVDLVLGDKIALAEWLKRGKEASCCRFVADVPWDNEAFGEGYGIGMRKQDTVLRERLDAALLAIQADGTYDAIRARYFPFDVK
ncbi:MAG: transporter substrate-binding domain-containing protein [Alsobacter sp.]